jgi:hypothetical protein
MEGSTMKNETRNRLFRTSALAKLAYRNYWLQTRMRGEKHDHRFGNHLTREWYGALLEVEEYDDYLVDQAERAGEGA